MNAAFLLMAGLVVLVAGAELLVRGASRLAALLGLSPLVIGLTVVAYGTSAPELSVSAIAASGGRGDIALGNVVGSNIFNVLFILGVSALIVPLRVSAQLVRIDVPLMIGASVLLLWFSLDGRIGSVEGALLLAGAVIYTAALVIASRRSGARVEGDGSKRGVGAALRACAFVAAGLALLVLGASWLVDGATVIARLLGVSDLVIGLTIVAGGTSLPELATSLLASVRGQRDIAVGNIIGSNLFNILAILGVASLIADIPVAPAALRFDIPIMILVAVACLPVFFSGGMIGRIEGLSFLLFYAAYVLYLILASTGHDALPAFSRVMLWFVLPFTFLIIMVNAWRWRGAERP